MRSALGLSERRACRTLDQARSTQRRQPTPRADEAALTEAVVRLEGEYGRYGYRRITALLRAEGCLVNAQRVERLWRREGLKVPRRHLVAAFPTEMHAAAAPVAVERGLEGTGAYFTAAIGIELDEARPEQVDVGGLPQLHVGDPPFAEQRVILGGHAGAPLNSLGRRTRL